MSTRRVDFGRSAQTASHAGAFVQSVAGVANPSKSALGRVAAAVSAAKLGARVLPAGWRLVKRYPVASAVTVAALVGLVYLTRPMRMRPRETGGADFVG